MAHSPDSPFLKHLDCIKDPRRHNTRHLLYDMLLISLCAIISGADSWVQVSEYGRSKIDWFKEFLELPNSIPSHDTFAVSSPGSIPRGSMTSSPDGYRIFPSPSRGKKSPSMVKRFADPMTELTASPRYTWSAHGPRISHWCWPTQD